MPLDTDHIGGPYIRDDDEGLFSRDINGQLIRLDAPTEHDYAENVTLQIDGQPVTVPLAEPQKDAAGNIIQDIHGRSTPRYTTIYDAVTRLYVKQPGDEAKIPIPTLCHQPHMTPVAVCRLCVVQIYGQKRGKRAPERKLLPACQHQVKNGMEVFTANEPGPDGDRVRQSVKVLTEMLAANNLKPVGTPALAKELEPLDELRQMASRFGADGSRLKIGVFSDPPPAAPPMAGRRKVDASSPVFLVNHDACILCERCIRACNDVVKHNVIGRTGKGNTAGIGFDLNFFMGESSCVKCGECMVSCPTSAITFKPTAQVRPASVARWSRAVPAAELVRDPVFTGIPPKFLIWQRGLVIRRKFRPGQVLFRQGEPGNTAFLIKSGKLRVTTLPYAPGGPQESLGGAFRRLLTRPVMRVELTPENLIVGEMACLSGSPRTATLKGVTSGEVWELRRNVLDRLMRMPSHRERLEKDYRERAMQQVLPRAEIFKNLETAEFLKIVEFLSPRITFVRVSPGQELFHQGDTADAMYMMRLGNVRVGLRRFEGEMKVISRGPGSIIGEIGLLGLSARDANLSVQDADMAIKAALERGGDAAIPAGRRTATCSALGHLEMARLGRAEFLQLVRNFPVIRRRLVEQSLARLRSDNEHNPVLREYVSQGLYEGQSLLVLDLERCTRCDECVKACVQQHGSDTHGAPVTRLLRDGLHFANFMVATACRSCTDAYCMIGCPVDSIHRGRHGQIVIEDHCIGCGLCASNCPYGNIFMAPNKLRHFETLDPMQSGRRHRMSPLKAATCDLCDSAGQMSSPHPRCVSACPHEAAARMTGDELLRLVNRK